MQQWCKSRPFVVLTRFQKHGNRFHSEREFFEKRVCPLRRGREFLYTVLRPGRNKIFSLITARRFRPDLLRTAAGLCLCAGRSRPLPAVPKVMPQPASGLPSGTYGRRRYNTLDLASKIVCHGNSLFPLDPLGFPSPARPNVLHLRCLRKCKKAPTSIRRHG